MESYYSSLIQSKFRHPHDLFISDQMGKTDNIFLKLRYYTNVSLYVTLVEKVAMTFYNYKPGDFSICLLVLILDIIEPKILVVLRTLALTGKH